MSIQIEYGLVVLRCDDCPTAERFVFDTWDEAREYMRINRWKTEKVEKEWFNICPDCQVPLEEGE